MPATVVVGGQWGDEGKAKVIDYIMPKHDVIVRYQGGANAGHTVVIEAGRFAFHQIPSGLLYPHVTAILGNGMVVDPFAFLKELEKLVSRGIDTEGRIFISSAAQVVMPYHTVLDNLYEGFFGRPSDPAGQESFLEAVRTGRFIYIIETFIESDEFKQRLKEASSR